MALINSVGRGCSKVTNPVRRFQEERFEDRFALPGLEKTFFGNKKIDPHQSASFSPHLNIPEIPPPAINASYISLDAPCEPKSPHPIGDPLDAVHDDKRWVGPHRSGSPASVIRRRVSQEPVEISENLRTILRLQRSDLDASRLQRRLDANK